MKVIAQRGEDPIFLVETGGGLGRIVDLSLETVFEEMSIPAIAAKGYWEDVIDTEAALQALKMVEEQNLPLGRT